MEAYAQCTLSEKAIGSISGRQGVSMTGSCSQESLCRRRVHNIFLSPGLQLSSACLCNTVNHLSSILSSHPVRPSFHSVLHHSHIVLRRLLHLRELGVYLYPGYKALRVVVNLHTMSEGGQRRYQPSPDSASDSSDLEYVPHTSRGMTVFSEFQNR